jgi:hypothetical protein
MAHDDDLPWCRCRGGRGLEGADEVDAFCDLLDILVETGYAPAAEGGGELDLEDGPVGWFEGGGEGCYIGDGAKAICQAADEDETVWFSGCGAGEFKGD